MKKVSLYILVFGVIWGCGQRKDAGPNISNEQKALNQIKEDISLGQDIKKQQAESVFNSLCEGDSGETLSKIKKLSKEMAENPLINDLNRENDLLNQSAFYKLATIKKITPKQARNQLYSNYRQLEERLPLKVGPDGKMFFVYLATASSETANYIQTLENTVALYSEMGVSRPSNYYLGKLAYFLTEIEAIYKIDKVKIARQFIEMFKASTSSSELSIYTHITKFINDSENDEFYNILKGSSTETFKYIKLSMALGVSIESIRVCVEKHQRGIFQTMIPLFYYNNEERVLHSLEILSLQQLMQNQDDIFGYLVFLI
ncbi:MAG: hypothetical protein MK008_00780 [Bdellovibrionales bacterium]|nr:hypothetical protein [Bdellovibrionales bacterium]